MLCVIDWTYNAFLASKRYVVIDYRQLYATTASTFVTLFILPTYLVKALTSVCLPEEYIM